MTKQQLEKEVQRLKEELELANGKAIDFENKEYYIARNERCHLYDDIFFSIKSYLESGGEIILRPRVTDSCGE